METPSSSHPKTNVDGKTNMNTTIVDLFDYWALRTPQRPAAEWEGNTMTYSQLRTASLHVSRALLNAGVVHGARVPLLTRMSLEMLPAIIGILRVGACYCPIDVAAWSVPRIQYALEALSSSIALATTWCPEVQLPIITVNFQAAWLLDMPSDDANTLNEQLAVCRKMIRNDDLVWIFFTSGTTGKPKGVMIPHSAAYAYSLVQLMEDESSIENIEFRNLLAFSVSFDGCASVIWTTLTRGQTLVMASAASFPDISSTCDALMLTPSMLEIIDPRGPYDRVRYVFLGAEDPSREVIRQWITPTRKLYTTYGPSETTCIISIGQLDPDREITLGGLLPGFKVVLVDDEMQETDQGEMLIAGPGVGLGYLNNPELTSRKFIQWNEERYYRTGDLARRAASGQLVWAGRVDSLVKNRGFLINLETEVEATMMKFPPVQKAVALKWRDRLVGYVQPAMVDVVALREFMKARVDPFVIPDEITTLDRIPLNANGKVNKTALETQREERWQKEQAQSESRSAPAVTPELLDDRSIKLDALRTTFSQCLHVGKNQLDESSSFTTLGGNSFNAIRASQLLKRFGYEASPVQILRSDTLRELEQVLTRVSSEPTEVETQTSLTETSGRIPVTPIQGLFLRRSIDNPAAVALIGAAKWVGEASKRPPARALHEAFIKAMSAHDIFSTRFHLRDMTQSRLGRLNLNWHEVTVQAESEFDNACITAERLATREMASLTKSDIEIPYFHLTCICDPDLKVLGYVIGAHHILLDVIGQTVLAQDVDRALAGQHIPPGPSMEMFAKYMNQLKQQELGNAIRIVEDMLRPLATKPVLQLPKIQVLEDRVENSQVLRGMTDDFHQRYLRLEAPEVVIRKTDLDAAARGLRCTPSTLVYAAWSLFLSGISPPESRDHVGFRISLSGRSVSWPDAESVVGCLANGGPFSTAVPRNANEEQVTVHDWLKEFNRSILEFFALDGLFWALPQALLSCPHTNTTNVLCFLNMDPPSNSEWSYTEVQKHLHHISWYVFQSGDYVTTRFEIQRQYVDAGWAASIASFPARILESLINSNASTPLLSLFS